MIDLQTYRDEGLVLVRQVFDAPTIDELRRETDALLDRASSGGRAMDATWRGTWRETAGVGLAEKATTRVDSIGIGSPFPMHQDYPYFPHETDAMIAAIIHFDDATVANGCICAVPGSHKLGPLEHKSDGSLYLPMEEWPLERALPVEARAGDVLLFSYLTVHGSYINRSEQPRRILLVQMRSPENKPLTEQHRSPGQGTMLRGINPNALEI